MDQNFKFPIIIDNIITGISSGIINISSIWMVLFSFGGLLISVILNNNQPFDILVTDLVQSGDLHYDWKGNIYG
jgi:hypothetical protein